MIALTIAIVLFGVALDAVSEADTPWCSIIGMALGVAALLMA